MTQDATDIQCSMRSLTDSEIIQPGDLQWTDRDGKYRLANFTQGMKAIDAIKRGASHGERWVFYRVMRASEVAKPTAEKADLASNQPAVKRYRDPTQADLRDGPIECEYRDNEDEQWRSGFLIYILNGSMRFLCTDKMEQFSGQWEQCQIEVAK